MLSFFKKNWLLVALAFTAALLISTKFYYTNNQQTLHNQAAAWNGVVPGKTKESGLLQTLGSPKSQEQQDGNTIFNYNSGFGDVIPNKVYTNNKTDTVGLIKEQVWIQEDFSKVISRYGQPDGEYFGPSASMGFKVYVFSQQGLAYVASQKDGFTLEIWHFPPTSLTNFLSTLGKDLKTQPEGAF